QFIVPVTGVNIEQHRTRRVTLVGHMHFAFGQLPNKPGIDGAEYELTSVRLFPRAWNVFKDPANLRPRKVRVDHEPGLFLDKRDKTICAHLIADRSGASVLPDNRVEDRVARVAIPNHGRFALVCDADCCNIFVANGRAADGFGSDANLACPNLVCVMFHPAWLWEDLSEFFLGNGEHFT